jgi:hypothetical protein
MSSSTRYRSVAKVSAPRQQPTREALRCRGKFLRFFPRGFEDETYLDWERNYKWEAHQRWEMVLAPGTWRGLMRRGEHAEVARRAVTIEARTNLLFSFEKMALRDAVKAPEGAAAFAEGLFEFLHGSASEERRFTRWCEVVGGLPRHQTRVLTWPVVTVFGFVAQPERHIFLKPRVTRLAAEAYGFDFRYQSRPNWDTYRSLREFADRVRQDQRDLGPRDLIDVQSFIWVQGSNEYE